MDSRIGVRLRELATRLLTASVVAGLVGTGVVASGLVASGGSAATGEYTWPLAPRPSVVRGFDPPEQRWMSGHRGVDLASTAGAVVRSAGSGVVNFAGEVAGKQVVSVRHADGILTTYEPVEALVTAGRPVARGDPLGTLVVGHAGCVGVCLHWGARRGAGSGARYLDPLALLGVSRVRLKPLQPGDA
ncbi:murein hydrolase activator EnvC family protein [Williamsia maris]|uniref:Peptidase family M23 n=1 Tax=Williamsia maris TaxID=72806 RepID=A0ABT1HKX2_9NOCA|nr:M23 family metallopeptidase [Williamsia maris]MCP2178583.1 Peptidase family M23 [Williamsia maris]